MDASVTLHGATLTPVPYNTHIDIRRSFTDIFNQPHWQTARRMGETTNPTKFAVGASCAVRYTQNHKGGSFKYGQSGYFRAAGLVAPLYFMTRN